MKRSLTLTRQMLNSNATITKMNVEVVTGLTREEILAVVGGEYLLKSGFADKSKGFSGLWENVRIHGSLPNVYVEANLGHLKFLRVLNIASGSIFNHVTTLDSRFYYQGHITSLFGAQRDAASKLGFRKITTEAIGDFQVAHKLNSYIYYAKLGFTCISSKELAKIVELTKQEFGVAVQLEDLVTTNKGEDWWIINGFPFRGEFDLTLNSRSNTLFARYFNFNPSKSNTHPLLPFAKTPDYYW